MTPASVAGQSKPALAARNLLDLKYGLDDDWQIGSQRDGAEDRPSVYAAFSKNVDHEIRRAVENLRMFLEVRSRVDEALELYDTLHAIETGRSG